MKRIVVIVAVSIGALLALVVGGIGVKLFVLSPKSRPAPPLTAPSTPAAIARGEYLANTVMLCVGCHSQGDVNAPGNPISDPTPFAGRNWSEPGEEGVLVASNLTFDPETGLGKWTDGEVVRAIREGISRDGRGLFPMMPYQVYRTTLSDDDALAIVAYLRSLPPVKRPLPTTKLPFPMSLAQRLGPLPVETPVVVPARGTEAYGAWLLRAASCANCHDSIDDQHEVIPGKEFAGGQLLDDKRIIYAANITPDPVTGLGAYSDDDLMRAIDGTGRSGKPLMIMPSSMFRNMTDTDKKAIVEALRKLKPVVNVVGGAAH